MTTTLTEKTYKETILDELAIEEKIRMIATDIRNMKMNYYSNESFIENLRKIKHSDMRKTIKATDNFMLAVDTQIDYLIMKRLELEEELFKSEEKSKSTMLSCALSLLLEESGISSALLAHKLGFHEDDINNILEGNPVPYDIIDLIASYFNVKKESWYNF